MHYIYILFSPSAKRYYIGETEDIEIRIKQHNDGFFKGSSTAIAKDWELKMFMKVDNRSNARKVESYIKSMKSKVFIEKLINDTTFYETFKIIIKEKYNINIL